MSRAPAILVIEDDITLNRLIVAQLNRLEYETTGARTWKEADAYLEAHEPHLIITDVRLSDGDTLRRLADLVKLQPVIVLTAYGSVREAVAAMKAGASEYLLKPASPDELSPGGRSGAGGRGAARSTTAFCQGSGCNAPSADRATS